MKFTSLTTLLAVLTAILVVGSTADKDGTCGCEEGRMIGKHFHSRMESCKRARSKCQRLFKNDCKKGCVCPKSPHQCKIYAKIEPGYPKRVNMVGTGMVWRCEVQCVSRTFDCERPGAIQDPHFTDFSGVRFDFHGIDGNRYVLLAREGGDVLVAQMSEKTVVDPVSNTQEQRTFFESFGLQTGFGNKFKISIGRQLWDGKERWAAVVEHNGKVLKDKLDDGDLSVRFNEDHREVYLGTKDLEYSFTAVPRKGQERLDFHVKLIRQITFNDRFMGVLGMSLNKKVGHEVRFGLMKANDLHPDDLEISLRDEFEVSSLHPDTRFVFSHMHGIVHMSKKMEGESFHTGLAHGLN